MDEEKLIQVSFQIPPRALDSISRLAEQLRLLTQAAGALTVPAGRTVEIERMESGFFDPARFDRLRWEMADPAAAEGTVSDIAEPASAAPGDTRAADTAAVSAALSRMDGPAAVSAGVREDPADAKSAGDEFPRQFAQFDRTSAPERETPYTLSEERGDPLPPAGTPEMRELALSAARGEATGGIEAPAGTGVVVQTQLEPPRSRWSGVAEELMVPGEAPLTAEAVSMAFERDGRRYDNGFPLY